MKKTGVQDGDMLKWMKPRLAQVINKASGGSREDGAVLLEENVLAVKIKKREKKHRTIPKVTEAYKGT